MPSTERIIHSPDDPEARYSQKRGTEWFGSKAHLTETCDNRVHLDL
jgi:transposase